MANENDRPGQSSAAGRPDDDLPTSQIPAMRGPAFAAAQAQAGPGSTQPRIRVEKPAEPADTEITLVRPRIQAEVIVASTPAAAPLPRPAPVPPKPVEPASSFWGDEQASKPIFAGQAEPARPVSASGTPVDSARQPDSAPPKTPTPPKKPTGSKRPRRKHRVLVGVLIALLVLALSGATGVAVAANRYGGQAKLGTTLAGQSVTGQTEQELTDTVAQLSSGLGLTVSVNGKQQTFALGDLGISVDTSQTVANVLDQNGRFSWWPFRFTNFPLVLDYSIDDVQQAIANAMFGDDQHPVDATVELDESTSTYETIAGHDGTTVDVSPISDALSKLADGEAVDTITLDTTVQPAGIQTATADQAVVTANNMVNQQYTFSSDKKSYTLKANQVAPWVTFDSDSASGNIAVSVDDAAVADQLPDILNSHVANPPVDKRVLYSPEGNQIAVESWGQSGTVVQDTDTAVAAMQAALSSATPLAFTVATKAQTFSTQKITVGGAYDQANGSKWIDVNQKTFKVTLYKGTTFVKQFTCVTGAAGTPSTNGTFYISRKFTAVTMVGRNVNGTSYVSPNVPWTSFYHNGEALHGAPWRSSFGYRGSHGCINLPVSAAKFIFDWAPLGTRVVVHW